MAADQKKPTSYTLSGEAKALLALIAKHDDRSMSKALEHLIKGAAKERGISLPALPAGE